MPEFKSISSIGGQFVRDCEASGIPSVIALKERLGKSEESDDQGSTDKPKTKSQQHILQEFKDGKVTEASALAAGFEVKSVVQHNSTKCVYVIASFHAHVVNLLPFDNQVASATVQFPIPSLINEFKTVKTKTEVKVSGASIRNAAAMPVFTGELCKAWVRIAMHEQWIRHFGGVSKVDVVLQPKRMVVASCDIKRGEVRLVGLSPSVAFGEKVPADAFDTESHFFNETCSKQYVYITPKRASQADAGGDTMIVPYWNVKGSADESLVNMHKVTVKVKVVSGNEDKSVAVPIMTSRNMIKAGQELCFEEEAKPQPKPIIVSAPLHVEEAEAPAGSSASTEPPTRKRQKQQK